MELPAILQEPIPTGDTEIERYAARIWDAVVDQPTILKDPSVDYIGNLRDTFLKIKDKNDDPEAPHAVVRPRVGKLCAGGLEIKPNELHGCNFHSSFSAHCLIQCTDVI